MQLWDPKLTSEKQLEFFRAKERFICYGGARGGGKSWSVRKKAMLLGVNYPGIRMLLLRRSFPELRENHILPLMAELKNIATYKETDKAFTFPNGSRLRFGYCDTESDVNQYQGQEYDVIFLDEATQFTKYQFDTLTACVRGANNFPKRMYLTCNPGGVGHEWVKRLFIDKQYTATENPADYRFISATVYDNKALLEQDTGYVSMLENLPEDLRRAWLHGEWDSFEGRYFKEFSRNLHVCQPFEIPSHWRHYITMDYGLDMLAAYRVSVDEHNHAYVTGEVYESGCIISEAAQRIIGLSDGYDITDYLAPPDLWNSRQETGKSVSDIFYEHGIMLTKTNNDRVAGWMAVHDRLHQNEDGTVGLKIFENCINLIRCLPLLQYDQKRPNDVANQPHELTHAPDALRGFCVYWTRPAAGDVKRKPDAIRDNFHVKANNRAPLGQGGTYRVI